MVVTKDLPGERWIQILTSAGCRVEVSQHEDTILSNATIKQLIGHKCHGVIGQLTEVYFPPFPQSNPGFKPQLKTNNFLDLVMVCFESDCVTGLERGVVWGAQTSRGNGLQQLRCRVQQCEGACWDRQRHHHRQHPWCTSLPSLKPPIHVQIHPPPLY